MGQNGFSVVGSLFSDSLLTRQYCHVQGNITLKEYLYILLSQPI